LQSLHYKGEGITVETLLNNGVIGLVNKLRIYKKEQVEEKEVREANLCEEYRWYL